MASAMRPGLGPPGSAIMDNGSPPPVRVVCREGAQVLQLAGVINIMAADALLAGARAVAAAAAATAGAGEGPVVIECADAESFDTCALQILVALQRELARQGRSLHLSDVGAQAAQDLALAGLSREFEVTESGAARQSAGSATGGIAA